MKISILAVALLGLAAAASLPANAASAQSTACTVSLSQDPLVMRIGKDEFRIAFGVNGELCKGDACSGSIKYQTTWKTEDGATKVEQKLLSYEIPHGANRTVAVDRHYFDTAEGKHTTQIVQVSVNQVSCARGADASLAQR